jgi:hypothetical protein
MWGWANRSLPACVTNQLSLIKQFGKREDIRELTKKTFVGDEDLGWKLAAVATRILGR